MHENFHRICAWHWSGILVGGFPLVRKFATDCFTGNEVYVILTRNGQMEVYKNPNAPYSLRRHAAVDDPMGHSRVEGIRRVLQHLLV